MSWRSARAATILYDEMATREPTGETLADDVLLLALATDNIGRPGAGSGPLFEDNNSLGARDMGVLPDLLPGYRSLADDQARSALSAVWNASVSATPGLDYDAMLAPSSGLRALYVMGADPARHATPEHLARAGAPAAARRAGSLPHGDGTTRACRATGALLRRERRHVHQYRPHGAGGAPGDDAAAGARADWEILVRWPARWAWGGATRLRRRRWPRSRARSRSTRARRAGRWGRRAHTGRFIRRA